MVSRRYCCALMSAVLFVVPLFVAPLSVQAETITFDDLTLAPNSYWNGPDTNGTTVAGPYGDVIQGSFSSHGVTFGNSYDTTYGSWSGFAYSNTDDTTTPGFGNQFSAYSGSGRGLGQDNYGVAFGHHEIGSVFGAPPFDPQSLSQLSELPHFDIPTGQQIEGAYLNNTTYAGLSMLNGDAFAKQFGVGDWFKVTAYGSDASGLVLSTSVDFYLADFQSPNHLIVSDWTYFDLSSLKDAQTIYFNLTSSDVGAFGMNTPAYFAIDDIQLKSPAPAPEPTSLALLLIGGLGVGCLRRSRSSNQHGILVVSKSMP